MNLDRKTVLDLAAELAGDRSKDPDAISPSPDQIQSGLSSIPQLRMIRHPGDRDPRSRVMFRFFVPRSSVEAPRYRVDEWQWLRDQGDGTVVRVPTADAGPVDVPVESVDQLRRFIERFVARRGTADVLALRAKQARVLAADSLRHRFPSLEGSVGEDADRMTFSTPDDKIVFEIDLSEAANDLRATAARMERELGEDRS